MKKLLSTLAWQFKILHRNNLINISVVVTVLYALVFFLIKDLPNIDRLLTLLIYNDPAIIGLFFVGLSVIMEKNEGVLSALFVSPLNHHVYLISKLLALSIVGTLCTVAMALALPGVHLIWAPFVLGVFSTCFIFSLMGVFLVSFTTEFLDFMLRSIPLLLLLSTPLLNYYQLTAIKAFQLSPLQGPFDWIVYG